MNAAHLVTMANQIGAFFESQGGHEAAVAGIADHLRRFWEARMLRALGAHVDAGAADLRASVVEAVRRVAPAAAVPPSGPAAAATAAATSALASTPTSAPTAVPTAAPTAAPTPAAAHYPSRTRAGGSSAA